MLQTCYARQDPSIINHVDDIDEKKPGVVIVNSEIGRDTGAAGLEFGGYLERFEVDGLERNQRGQGFPSNHSRQQHYHPHTHQSNRSTSSQASSSSTSSFSSASQTGDRIRTHPYAHGYPHSRDQRKGGDLEEDYTGGDTGRMPEMDSPGKTSDLSSSMCSTPSAISAHLPGLAGRSCFPAATHGFTPCASPSPEAGRLVLDLTHFDDNDDDMSITPTPPTSSFSSRRHNAGSKANVVPAGLTIDLGDKQEEEVEVERSSPHHRKFSANARPVRSCLSRTTSSPAVEVAQAYSAGSPIAPAVMAEAGGSLANVPPRLFTSHSESETLSTRSHRISLGRPAGPLRRVTFCEKLPSTFPTHPNYDYDRSPHPVVLRLSYRDVLELREMKVEMALVTKRQQGAAGLTDDALLGINKARSIQEAGLGLQTHRDGRPHSPFSLFEEDESVENLPPSPSALTSSFPSSIKLVSRLHEMGEFRPPARERGMGLKVEPTFGLDRVASGDSLRDDFAKHLSGNGEGSVHSLRRKTSGEFAVEESDFQKELRKAREELEAIAVQEARLGMASQLGGAKSNKGEQHSVAMGSSGSSTPHGLGIIRPSPSFSSDSINGGNRSRKSSLASQQGGANPETSSSVIPGARAIGLPTERASFAPVHQSIKSGILSSGDQDEGSLLFPSKTPTVTKSFTRIARPTPPPLSSKSAFRPPSPILAPFARSGPIRATTQRTDNLGSARTSQETSSKGSIFDAPAPILAPFARSSTMQQS